MVAVVTVLAIAAAATATYLVVRESPDDAFLNAARDANILGDFPSEKAALVKARRVCGDMERSGDLSGGEFEKLAVSAYCDEFASDFIVLETATVKGTFEVVDSDEYAYYDDGDGCEGDGGYGDINSSTQVIVRNTSGDELARTELGPGEVDGISCRFSFSFELTDGEETYVLSVGDRGESTYTFDEILLGPALSLG